MAKIKPEFPPLLPQGFHRYQLDDLKSLVVDPFEHSSSREPLWASFVQLLEDLKAADIKCVVWVDGSFVTQKIDPDDVDLVVEIEYDTMNTLNPSQRALVVNLRNQAFRQNPRKLHTFVIFSAPIVHKAGASAAALRKKWEGTFGYSLIKKTPKGIVQVEVSP